MYCNASRDGLGCVLMQSEMVVAYGSRKLKIRSRIILHMIRSWRLLSLPYIFGVTTCMVSNLRYFQTTRV